MIRTILSATIVVLALNLTVAPANAAGYIRLTGVDGEAAETGDTQTEGRQKNRRVEMTIIFN